MKSISHISNKLLVVVLALIFFISQLSISVFKIKHNLYNLLDLGIFKNALNQEWSNLLYSTIQGHHYYADHLSPYLIPIKLVYNLLPHQLTLITLQLAFLIWGGFELSRLIRDRLSFPLDKVVLILYFFNPWLWMIALNEFHVLPLLIPFFLITWRYFENNNFKNFAIWFFLTLILREDVCLVLIFFSLFSILQKKPVKWILLPLLSVPYFFFAQYLMGIFGSNGYTFLIYYSWLGDSWLAIAKSLFTSLKPWVKIFSFSTFNFLVASLLPFLFLVHKKPLYLIFGSLTFLSLALGPGASPLVLKFHYFVPILCGMLLAFTYTLAELQKSHPQFIKNHGNFIILLSLIIAVMLQFNFGPIPEYISKFRDNYQERLTMTQNQIIDKIPANSSVLTSSAYVSAIPTGKIYYLKYAMSGKQQFDKENYALPDDLEYILLDTNELIFNNLRTDDVQYVAEIDNLRNIIKNFEIQEFMDSYVLFKKSDQSDLNKIIEVTNNKSNAFKRLNAGHNSLEIEIALTNEVIKNNRAILKFDWQTNNNKITRYFPLAYGLISSNEVGSNSGVTTRYNLIKPNNVLNARWSVVEIEGDYVSDNLISAVLEITKEKIIIDPQTFYDVNAEAL